MQDDSREACACGSGRGHHSQGRSLALSCCLGGDLVALHFIELVIDSHWIILFCRKFLAANGAIMRTAILGVLKFNGESWCWCFSDSDTYVCVAMGVLVTC